MSLTIGKRIGFGFTVVVALVILLGGFAIAQLSTLGGYVDVLGNGALPGVSQTLKIQVCIARNFSRLYRHIGATDLKAKDSLEEAMKKTSVEQDELMAEYAKSIDSEEERAVFAKVEPLRLSNSGLRKQVLELSRGGKNAEAYEMAEKDLFPVYDAYQKALADVAAFNEKAAAQNVDDSTSARKRASNLLLIGLAASALLAGACAFIIIRFVTKALTRVAGSLTQGSTQVASAATQVSGSSQSLAQGASEQAAALEETTSAMEEMSSMTRKNAETAQEAASLSSQANAAAEKSNTAMGRMSSAINEIQQSAAQTAKIIKVIDEIAFQTNLLALNAAVEAARAGEAGKGFAVVAEEVRNLAMRSAEAAKNTSELIEQSVNNARNGVAISVEVAQSLGEITGAAGKMNHLVTEIAAASKEQAQGISQVNTSIGQMDKVTQATAANAEESAAASEELSAQAETMAGVVRELLQLVSGAAGGAVSHDRGQASLSEVHSGTTRSVTAPKSRAKAAKKGSASIPLDDSEKSDFADFGNS